LKSGLDEIVTSTVAASLPYHGVDLINHDSDAGHPLFKKGQTAIHAIWVTNDPNPFLEPLCSLPPSNPSATSETPAGSCRGLSSWRWIGGWIIRSPKENPVDGSPGETTVSQKIDDYHGRTIFKKDGKEIGKLEGAISSDGKTMTNRLRACRKITFTI
jgi:hypothetical protein